MKMSLYTIILDYNGGTYISQIEENSPYKSLISWIKEIDLKNLNVGHVRKSSIVKKIREFEEEPLPLSGIKNVWCVTFILNKKLALVHIIKTNRR